MELKVFWTEFSENELRKIFEYYSNAANYEVAEQLVTGIFNETQKLKKQSEIGQA